MRIARIATATESTDSSENLLLGRLQLKHGMHRPHRKHTTYYRCRLAFGANIRFSNFVKSMCVQRQFMRLLSASTPLVLFRSARAVDHGRRCSWRTDWQLDALGCHTDIHRFDRLLLMNIDSSLRFVVARVPLSSAWTQDDGEEEEVNHVWQHCEQRGNK